MEGIAYQLIAKQKGTIQYEVINDADELSVLETKGYYLTGLQLRLFCPQTYLKEHQGGEYTLEWDKLYLQLKNGEKITIGYHSRNSLLFTTKIYQHHEKRKVTSFRRTHRQWKLQFNIVAEAPSPLAYQEKWD